MNPEMWTCPCHLPRPQLKVWVSHKPWAVLWGTRRALPKETRSRALGKRPLQRQSPLQTQHSALHHQVFHFGQPPTAFHSRATRPSPRTVVLCSPFASQRERSKSAPSHLKFSALASPPWLWGPALSWAWSQPQHRLGTRWSWLEDRHLTSSLHSLPPCAYDGTPHPSLLSSQGCHKGAAHFPAKTAATPLVPALLPTSALEHTKFWSIIAYSFSGLAVVIVSKLDGMLKS